MIKEQRALYVGFLLCEQIKDLEQSLLNSMRT
jgi:hypothetical protein